MMLHLGSKLLLGWIGDSKILIGDFTKDKEKVIFLSARGAGQCRGPP